MSKINYDTNHITIYGNLFVMRNVLKLPDITLTAYIRHSIGNRLRYTIHDWHVERVLERKPKTYYMVKYLQHLQFGIDTICSLLDITRAAYYYNVKHPVPYIYYNDYLDDMANEIKVFVLKHPSWEGVRLEKPLTTEVSTI